MIGAAGSRHPRRRASLAVSTHSGGSGLFNPLDQLRELDEGAPRPSISRRRVVDTSDLKSCAILQTRLKEVKHYPE